MPVANSLAVCGTKKKENAYLKTMPTPKRAMLHAMRNDFLGYSERQIAPLPLMNNKSK
jgi:hypothetical protein